MITSYVTAAVTIVLLDAAGTSLGVRLSVAHWLEMTGLILIALLPFAALGVILGHLLTADSIGPAMGGTTALFAFLGGSGSRSGTAARSMTSHRPCPPSGSFRPATSQSGATVGVIRAGS